jgi:hypothetical protein
MLVRWHCYYCKTTTTLEVLRQGPGNENEGRCCFCGHPFFGALVPTDPQETVALRKVIKVF